MQPDEEIMSIKRSSTKQSVRLYHLSSFGNLNRNWLEIPKGRDIQHIEEDNEIKPSESPQWPMPEQPSGYIKCKKHDFL
jgi:hypothetical protein